MYSTLALTNSKKSGNIVGTHQKLDRIARKLLQKNLFQISRTSYFLRVWAVQMV